MQIVARRKDFSITIRVVYILENRSNGVDEIYIHILKSHNSLNNDKKLRNSLTIKIQV